MTLEAAVRDATATQNFVAHRSHRIWSTAPMITLCASPENPMFMGCLYRSPEAGAGRNPRVCSTCLRHRPLYLLTGNALCLPRQRLASRCILKLKRRRKSTRVLPMGQISNFYFRRRPDIPRKGLPDRFSGCAASRCAVLYQDPVRVCLSFPAPLLLVKGGSAYSDLAPSPEERENREKEGIDAHAGSQTRSAIGDRSHEPYHD